MHQSGRLALGILVGCVGGLVVNVWLSDIPFVAFIAGVAEPIGKIFIRLLLMLVLPLAFSALVLGVSEIEPSQLGRLGAKTLAYTLMVSMTAVALGLTLVHWVKPGVGMPPSLLPSIAVGPNAAPAKPLSLVDLLVGIVPSNPIAAAANGDMLGFLVFALAFGIAMATVHTEGTAALNRAIQGLFDTSMRLIELVLRLAPIGIGALLFAMTARVGPALVGHLGKYVLVVVAGLSIHMFGVYSIMLRWIAKRSPRWFFSRVRLVMTTAFSTASSNATLPTALAVAEHELGLRRD
ncbi:MAG TPA: cation:dicarboxylase symporter family transporter, partial [Polyangiaceae bacterium]